jgi:hypothetical protein
MSLSGASGSTAGYADLILKIAMFVSSVYSMINMFLLRNITCHVLLFGAKIFFMMMLMTYYLDKHIYDIMQFLLASILWNKLNMNLPNFLTFQKCEFRQFSSVGFAGMLKPPPFEGTHYKRWRQKTILWLTSMRCFYVVTEMPTTVQTVDEQRQFDHTLKKKTSVRS